MARGKSAVSPAQAFRAMMGGLRKAIASEKVDGDCDLNGAGGSRFWEVRCASTMCKVQLLVVTRKLWSHGSG